MILWQASGPPLAPISTLSSSRVSSASQMAAHEKPFCGMDLEMLYTDVVYGGQRPKIPKQWPDGLRSLLKACWHPDPQARPEFAEVLQRLEELRGGGHAEK